MPRAHDPSYNRDNEQKPGSPPRMAQEPAGEAESSQSRKTMTDPATGEAQRVGPPPNQARTSERKGADGARERARDRNLPPA